MYKQLLFPLYCALLVLIAVSSSALQSDFGTDANTPSQNQNSSQFENATINAYDNMLNLLYRLNSPLINYRRDDGFDFAHPELAYQTSSVVPLQLSAQKGYMEDNSARIELLGDVKLFHLNPNNDMPEYLYTRNATVDLDTNKVYTDDKATFLQHKKTTEGIGMVVDLKTQTVKLKSNIKILNTF